VTATGWSKSLGWRAPAQHAQMFTKSSIGFAECKLNENVSTWERWRPKLFRFVDCIGRERRKMALDIKVIIIAAVLMAGHALSFILWISGWFVSAKILIFHFIFPFFFEICNHFTI
jgi:hypothetical protein